MKRIQQNWIKQILILSSVFISLSSAAFDVSVLNETDLNAAITDFNSQTSGIHTITVVNNITLTAPLTTINNPIPGTRLFLQGVRPAFISGENVKLINLDGDNLHQILQITGSNTNVRIDRINFINGNNTVGEGRGGAINIDDAIVSIFSSRFANNKAVGPGMFSTSGGAIYNSGGLYVGNSLFLDNSAPNSGGAIANLSLGTLTVVASTFVGNYVTGILGRGAAVNNCSVCEATIRQSTFIGNNLGSDRFDFDNDGGTLSVQSTLFAAGPDGSVASCRTIGGTFNDKGYNMMEDDSSAESFFCGMINGVNNNRVVTDAMIGNLSLTGGYAESIPLLEGSQAINNGIDNPIENSDQRGIDRVDGLPDIGAFEFIISDQFENNDTVEASTDINTASSFTTLNLSSKLIPDEDYYKVSLLAGKEARFIVTFSHDNSDIDIELFDDQNSVVWTSISTTDNEEISYTPTSDGDFFLRVYGFNGDQAYYDIEFDFESVDELCFPIKTDQTVSVICL